MPIPDQQIASILVQHGWTLSKGPNLASKVFDTAVGPRTALAWLTPGADGVGNRALRAEYQSEGRNILAGYAEVFRAAADSAVIERMAARFAGHVETAVRQSYAVRLLQVEKLAPDIDAEGLSPTV